MMSFIGKHRTIAPMVEKGESERHSKRCKLLRFRFDSEQFTAKRFRHCIFGRSVSGLTLMWTPFKIVSYFLYTSYARRLQMLA